MAASFKDELAAKLSARPMFGGRAPVPVSRPMFPSASSPPISPNSGAGASGDSARQRSLSAGVESSQENSSGQSEDPFMEVALQRVALSRQRKHRMPTRYSGNPKASNLPPDSSAAANGGSSLNRISEEKEEDDTDKDGKAHGRLRHDRCQNNRHSSNLNSRHSSSSARVYSSSDSDSSSVSSSEEDYFNRISKYPLREDREPASPCSAASSSSPCGQSLSYADRSEDDEEGVGGTASRSPLTSSSGDGLFDSSEPIVRPRTSVRPSSVRPSSMFVGGSLQEELRGIVQTRLSRIKSTTGEDQSVKLRPGPRPKQPHIRFRRSPPRTASTADQGHGFGVVLRRTAQNASGVTSTLETQHSSNSTSPSSGRRAVSMALTGLDDRPVRVHDLIKAFQRDSR